MKVEYLQVLRQKRDTIVSVINQVASLIEGHFSKAELEKSGENEPFSFRQNLFQETVVLRNYGNVLQQKMLTVALLSESSDLKGSLEGAILGTKMFMHWTLPAPVILDYGKCMDVTMYVTGQKLPRSIGWKTFVEELRQEGHQTSQINYVRIEREFPLLATGIQLVNFPRLADMERRKQIVDDVLRKADAIILVLDAENPRVENIFNVIKTTLGTDSLRHFFIVVNVLTSMLPNEINARKKKMQMMLQQYYLDERSILDLERYHERVFFVDVQTALKARTEVVQRTRKVVVPDIDALEEALARYLTTDVKIVQALEPTLKVLRSVVKKALTALASEKEQQLRHKSTPHSSYEKTIEYLSNLEKQLTELVKKANTTVYDQSNLAASRRRSETVNRSGVRQSHRQANMDKEPDPLRVWIDIEDHLQFVTQVVQRPDVPLPIKTKIQEHIEQVRRREHDPNLYMAVVGEFSSGKSTFINALLRQELLATSVLPTTATQTQFRYHSEIDLTVHFKTLSKPLGYREQSSRIWQHIRSVSPDAQIPQSDLQNCLYLVTADEQVAAHVKSVVIHHPASFLQDGIVIIDTPGMNALNEQHAKITYDLIEHESDSAVIIIPAPIPLSGTLIEFLTTKLKPVLHRCIFVVTQLDRIRERERENVLENIRNRLISALGSQRPVTLYSCAAQPVLDALEQESPDPNIAYWNEQFRDLEDALFERLRRERMLSITESLLRLLQQLYVQLDEYLRTRRASYELRQAAIESDVIHNLTSFAREQHAVYQARLKAAVEQARSKVEYCIDQQGMKAKEAIRKAVLDVGDISALEAVLAKQAGLILEEAEQAVTREMRASLQKLSKAAEQAGQAFDEEFTKEYRRLRAVSGLLVANDSGLHNGNLSLDVSGVLSPAKELNQSFNKRENRAIGGVALSGAAIGTAIMPGIGTVVGLFAGGFIGAMFGPSLEKRKTEVWQQLEPKLDDCFHSMDEAAKVRVESYAQELRIALDKRIDKYIIRYKTAVDSMMHEQKEELAQLNRLQNNVEQDRKELNRRRSIIERKQKELATSIM